MEFVDYLPILGQKFKEAQDKLDKEEMIRLLNLLIDVCEDTIKKIKEIK